MTRHETGDKGQRYEIWCKDADGRDLQIGWSDNPESFRSAVEKHPSWHDHRSVDRVLPDLAPPPILDAVTTEMTRSTERYEINARRFFTAAAQREIERRAEGSLFHGYSGTSTVDDGNSPPSYSFAVRGDLVVNGSLSARALAPSPVRQVTFVTSLPAAYRLGDVVQHEGRSMTVSRVIQTRDGTSVELTEAFEPPQSWPSARTVALVGRHATWERARVDLQCSRNDRRVLVCSRDAETRLRGLSGTVVWVDCGVSAEQRTRMEGVVFTREVTMEGARAILQLIPPR